MEPIAFDEDGLIAQVPMTSVGAGSPFTLGEVIEGWRSCEVSGGVLVTRDDDADHPDALVARADGGQGVFRYVGWEEVLSRVEVGGCGGVVEVLLDDDPEPVATLDLGAGQTVSGLRGGASAGKHTVRLRLSPASEVLAVSRIVFS